MEFDRARKVIRRALQHGKCGIAFSGGKDSTVILDLVRKIAPDTIAVFLDHGRHFPETYEFVKTIPNMVTITNTEWEPDPVGCCGYAKIDLISAAVSELNLDILFVGIRRDEHPARDVGYFEGFGDHARAYPILNWSEEDVWMYLKVQRLPVNALYDAGYRSVGCTNCSYPGGDNEREGRGSKELVMERLRSLGYF